MPCRQRKKKAYFPSFDPMERRDLPTASPLTAMSSRGLHAIGSEIVGDHHGQSSGHPSIAHPGSLHGIAGARARGPASPAGAGTLQEQADVATSFLRLADSILENLSKFQPGSEADASQARQLIAQLTSISQTQPSAVVSAPQSDPLESLLSTFGPGDPFASLGVISPSALKPGDIIARCTPGLVSQTIELAGWSRYSHVALYIGHGMVIDAVGAGVHTRSLTELLSESNRASVLRVPGLTAAQAQAVIHAAEAHEGAAYNFTGLAALEAQKLAAVISHANEGLGGIIGVLSRAERLPSRLIDNGTFACSQLVRLAYMKAGITLSHANGLAPGDVIRLGMVGVLDEVGRLAVPSQATSSTTGAWLP
ncbi:MAG: YiiX/YebB-like N1pC/P60 family cysteine hydrolase [Isosphaeraceae bacterium]|nr:YiiX/YebB-like N1pC/P60 family cysteine hydrolase [Isosphaeraceae bacterium]